MAKPDDPVRRWRRLVRAKFAEMARLSPTDQRIGPTFWDERAERYAARVAGTAARDPFTSYVRRHVGRRTVVVDVGAGTGRFSLALAPHAHEVVAVDPSAGMLAVLQREADRIGATTLRTVQARWEDTDVEGDVAICSFVLPLVEDVAPFLRKLDRCARRRVLVYLGAASPDLLVDPLWRHFHGRARAPSPTYLDAVAILRVLGITAEIRIVEVPAMSRFSELDDAVEDYRRTLCVADTPESRAELRRLLDHWLVREAGGLRAPVRSMPAAILSWAPAGMVTNDSTAPSKG